ncbi:MAG: hypothetical protein V1896_00915 [Candidatus Zambryskibacteria bacterium]
MKNFLIKNKFLVAIMLFAVLNIFVSYYYIGYNPDLGKKDAYEYSEAARFLQGNSANDNMQLNRVLTTPLFLYSSISVNYFFNDFSLSFATVNVVFYFLCVFVFYLLAFEIYKEEKVAILSSILVSSNFYMIDPGNLHLADFGGWFFFILGTFLAVKYINTFNRKFYYLSIIVSAVGVLFKEYGGLAVGNLILLICISDIPWRQKLKDVLIAVSLVLAPILSFHIFIYLKYHYLYFDRYVAVGRYVSLETPKNFILLVKILGWLFSFGWLAFCYGAWKELKTKDKRRIKILLAILPVTLTFYFWPSITQRLAVMFMMWLALIAGFGLSKIKWYWLYLFLVIYIVFNYNIESLIKIINLPF